MKSFDDASEKSVDNWKITFFDLGSSRTPQMGCTVQCNDGKRVTFLGDEPLKDNYLKYAKDSDAMLHEAFCTSDEVDRFKPYDKHHGTALEAGGHATKANAKLLALFHMEDETLATRKKKYTNDVKQSGFLGQVFVPKDLDHLEF